MINIAGSIFLILNIEDYDFFVIRNICYFTICLMGQNGQNIPSTAE